MKNKIFKKSISLVLTVLMVMSSWVFFPGMIPEAEAAATEVNVTTSFTLSPNGNRGTDGSWTRLALTGESSAAGTSVVLFRFTNEELQKMANLDSISLQFYAYSCNNRLSHNNVGVTVNADVYYITQNSSFVSNQGTNKSTNVADTGNSVLGTDYTYSYAQDKAKSYFGLSDTTLVGSFEQPNINGQDNASLRTGDANYSYPVTDIVKQTAASGEDLSFIVMLRQGYSCSGDRGWSDIYIDSDTIALSGYNMLEELKSKIEAYEGYFSNGIFYTNLVNNYKAYNDAKRYYDAVTYGGVQFNAATAQSYINAIDTAIANTGLNETYVDYLNANITSRDGSTVSAAYRKNVIWYPWDFSWDITSNNARPTIQDTYFYFTMPNTIVGITNDSETTFPLHSFFWTATGSRYVRYVIAGSGTISSGVVGSSDFSTMAPWKISDDNNTHTTSGLSPGTDGFGGWVFEKNYRTDVSLKNEENNSNNFSYSRSKVYQISSYAQINKSSIGVNESNTYKKVDQGFTFATANSANSGTSGYKTDYGNHYASSYSSYGGALYVVYMDKYKNNYQNWKTLIPALSYKDYNGFVYSDATDVTEHLDYASEIPLNLNLTEANRVGDISSTVTVWAQNINKGASDLANAKAAGTTRVTNKYVDLINAITNADSIFAGGSAPYTYSSWNNFVNAYNAAKAHMASLNPAGSNVQYSSDATAIGNLATALNNARNALVVRTYDVTYENMFSFSSWANSASGVIGTPNKGTMTYDVNAGTITFANNASNTQSYPNDHYSSYGFGNGHYNMTLVPGETYTFEYTTSGGTGDQVHIFFYDDNGNAVANKANGGSPFAHAYGTGRGTHTISFTAPENATKAAFRFGSTVLGDSITFSNIFMYSHTRGDYADIANWTTRPNRTVFTYNKALGEVTLEVPVRPGYTFDGWWVDSINPNGQKDEGEQVTDGNGTVVTNLQNFGIAQDWVLYSEWTPIMYTVTWENEDGTVLKRDENITYGTTPSYDGETPTKAADAQYTYTFKGWSPEVTEVTGDVTYTATYDKTPNSVTVTWIFADGTEKTESYTYGTTPTAPQNTASFNDAAGHHTYSWPTIGAVTGNVTYEEIEKTDAHNYNQQVATDAYKATDATCTAKATYYYSCSCGTKGTTTFEYGELAAHTPGAEATCTSPQTCTVCDAELAPQLAHTYDKQLATDAYKATDATCTAKATYYYSCSCGAKGTTTFEYGEMLAHSLGDWITDKEPTCITAGSKHKKCANCDYTETEAIAATGVHVYGDWAQFNNGITHRRTCTADANCTAFEEGAHNFNGALRQMDNGNYHQYKCEKCDAYGVGAQMNVGEACFGEGTTFTQIADNATQHTETCKCGRVQNDGHDWAGWVADPENTTDAQGKMSNTCSECGYKKTSDCTYTKTDSYKDPTCTDNGYQGWKCSDCGNGYTEILTATGHKEAEAVNENVVDATCTTDGSYDSVVYCTVCKTQISRETTTVDALGHTFGETVAANEATCVATGNEAYKQCTVCNKYFAADADKMSDEANDSADAFVIAKKDHSYTGEYKWNNAVEPKTHSQKCVNGCEEYGNETECTFDAVVTAPDCYNGGYTTYTCTVCKNSYQADYTTREHIYVYASGNGTSHTVTCEYENCNYTATENCSGGTAYCNALAICVKCNTAWGEKDANNHASAEIYVKDDKEATCTVPGYTGDTYHKCCDALKENGTNISAKGHKFGDWTTNNNGTHTRECTVCTDEPDRTDTVDCTYGDWTQTKAPTCTEKGAKERECTICNYVYKEDIPALNHIDEDNNGYCDREDCGALICDHVGQETVLKDYKKETCLEDGYTGDKHCKKCDVIVEYGTKIDKLGHKDEDKDHACDNGCDVYQGTHADSNSDHICDYGCQEAIGTCEDKNLDHACDYGCDKYFGTHADSATDNDHVCDYGCGEVLEECIDGDDNNHNCDICGKEDVSDHNWVDADCTTPKTCSVCGTTDGEQLGHDWAEATYNFAEEGSACTAIRECGREGCDEAETATATITSAVKTPATCTEKGWTTYTAEFDVDWAEKKTLDVQDIPAINHDWSVTYDFATDGKTCTATRICANDAKHNVTANATITSKVKTAATCTEKGTTTYTATFEETWAAEQTKDVQDIAIDANNHDGETYTKDEDIVLGTCISEKTWNEVTYCSDCNAKLSTEAKTGEKDANNHVELIQVEAKKETCESIGWEAYEYCTKCTYTTYKEIAATGHDYDETKSEANLTRPEFVDGTWTKGYYTYTCKNDSLHTTKEEVDRAAYTAYEAAWNNLESLLSTDITEEAKTDINKILTDNKIADNLIASEQNIVDTAEANLKYAFDQYKGSLNTYTVTFVVDGVETKVTVISGNDATAPTDVEKAYNDTYHYEFDKWDSDFTNVTSDITVTATFDAIEHTYTHTDKDDTYHTDSCDCGYSKDVKHTETSAVTTKASCYADGVRTFTCSVCSGTRTETIAKREHNLVDTTVVLAPTCSATGIMNQKCDCAETAEYKACDYTTTRMMDKVADAHKWETEYTVDKKASCDEAGSKSYHCEYCDTINADSVVEIAKREHNLVDTTVARAPTCSATGIMNQKCDCAETAEYEVCDYTTTRVMDKVADAHKAEAKYIQTIAPTCSAVGEEKLYCEYCDVVLDTQEVAIDKDAHTGAANVIKNAKEETCLENGYTGDIHWSCCDALETKGTVIPAPGHTEATREENRVEPSCGTAGSYDLVTYCTVCTQVIKTEKVSIPATGEHNFVTEVDGTRVPSTCKTPGSVTMKCGCGATEVQTIPVDENNHENIVTDGAVAPTCTKSGLTEGSHCAACDKVIIKQEEIPALGHKEDKDASIYIAPSCDKNGYVKRVCGVCGEIFGSSTIAPTGHKYTDETGAENFVIVPATCDAKGSKYLVCTVCGYENTKDAVPYGTPSGHYLFIKEGYAPTCTEDGLTEYVYCLREGCNYEVHAKKIPATGHKDNGDGMCSSCGNKLYESGSKSCGCLCHKDSVIMRFIYKIVLFFWKLFRIKHDCGCGSIHY